MKKIYLHSKIILVAVLLCIAISISAQEFPILIVNLENIEINSGEDLQLPATLDYIENTESQAVEVAVKWHVEPGYLGKFDRNGIFTARHPGEGRLIAKYKNARGNVKVNVSGDSKNDEENEYPKIKIIPGKVKIETGDYVELRGFYINELGEKEDVPLQWNVSDPVLGEFPVDTESMFFAGQPGQGYITATYGELTTSVKLQVILPKEKQENKGGKINIIPEYKVVHMDPGTTIQYKVELKDLNITESEIEWSVSNELIATIDGESGILTLGEETGITIVKAKLGKISASAELIVVDPDLDLTINTITVHRVLPDGNELPPKTFREGETFKIGGLPYPLNILNAGMIHFPFGCIHENITLYMFIPEEYAQMDDENSEVEFTEQIINGIKFLVQPEGSEEIAETYDFDIPINLCLVFKRGLLESLQINPEDLDVFFANNTGFVTADEEVQIDIVKNRIYAQIEHFSTIVIRQKSSKTSANELDNVSENSLNIYPNPFNHSTNIRFNLTRESEIEIAIYNMFGQPIKTLADKIQNEGSHVVTWDGTNETDSNVPNGIYLCRMIKDGNVSQVKRVVLKR